MKRNHTHPAGLFMVCYIWLLSVPGFAQLPVCTESGGILYYDDGVNIYNYDPALPVSATNPARNSLTFAEDAYGLALGPNLNATSPALTFYTYIGGYYYYNNGSQWVNTGHKASAVNLGAGGGYVYGIAPGMTATKIYQYDGSGDDMLLLTITDAASSLYDIIADCEGNFYVLNTGIVFASEEQWMRKYNASGQLVYQWQLKNVPYGAGGGGFGIIDNTVYFDNLNGQIYKGEVIGDTLDFSVIGNLTARMVKDIGSCPKPLFSSQRDTIYYCGDTTILRAQGAAPPYTFTVLAGNPIITGSGPEFIVQTTGIAEIVLQSGASGCSNDQVLDTFVIIPPPLVDAGPDDSIEGCAIYIDTLAGQLTNRTSWVNYTTQWTPTATISAGAQTLRPVITPDTNTNYILSVSTGPEQGNCLLTDTVHIVVHDRSVTAGFSYSIHYGCVADTVYFTSASTPGVDHAWNFGDGASIDTGTHPVHIYNHQDTFLVTLKVTNGTCENTAEQAINTTHPLHAAFSMDQDILCINGRVQFTNTSMLTHPDTATYLWDFGDGIQSAAEHPEHPYRQAGMFTVKLIATDFVPCIDTAYATVVVDAVSNAGFSTDKAAICVGESIEFTALADYTAQQFLWNFGDGLVNSSGNDRLFQHAYEQPGTFPVTLSTDFRVCPDTSFTDSITVYPFPKVDLGPDSSICPQGQPLYLKNLHETPSSANHQVWSTGDTTAVLKVLHPGTYTLSVSTEPVGCTTTESITIKKDCYIDIPNTFTPNGDGHNDYFLHRQLLGQGLVRFHMQVFNRWGQLLFETKSLNGRGWDGRLNGNPQPSGVYLYRISVDFSNGSQEYYEGNVTLIR